MKKIIGFITIVMVLIGLFACDTEQSGSIENGVPANTSNDTSNQSGDDSSSSASDSSSSSDDSSNSSSQSGDDSSSSASDSSSSSDDSSSASSQSGDSSSSSASDSSSSDDSSSASSQNGDDSSSSASDNSSSQSGDSSSSSQETITAQYTITVATPTYQDIDNLLTYSGNTFTALSGYQTYIWYIDRTKQSNSTSTLTPDTSSLSAGNHTVTVMVTDSQGGAYSAEMTFQVKKSY